MSNISLSQFIVKNPKINFFPHFDLHVHSKYSDGKYKPRDLVLEAAERNIKILSITDHNSIEAYDDGLLRLASEKNTSLIPGVEIECGEGLDVLVYDDEPNKISENYKKAIESLVNSLNSKRNLYIKAVISKIKDFLQLNCSAEFISWRDRSNKEKQKILSRLTFNNASRIDLQTGKLAKTTRKFVGKLHLIMLLAPFDLVNWDLFAKEFSIPVEKAPEYFLKYFFDKIVPWPLDNFSVDTDILNKVRSLPFVKIIAHPGKSFEGQFGGNINSQEFERYLVGLLHGGIDGAEGDYRKYENAKLNYNSLTQTVLTKVASSFKKPIYCTGGSDSHGLLD